MSQPDILFQYESTTATSSFTSGDLVFQASEGGQTLVTNLWACPSTQGTANRWVLWHCSATESPSKANMLYIGLVSERDKISVQIASVKIVLNPGDRLFAALYGGAGITITAYGLRPSDEYDVSPSVRDLETFAQPDIPSFNPSVGPTTTGYGG